MRNPVYAVTTSILLIAILLSSLTLWQYWSNIVKEAQSRSATLAFLLAEQTSRTFQAVDLTLGGLEPVLQGAPLRDHSADFEKLLAQRVAELDFIQALYVVNAAGHVTQSAGPAPESSADLSGRGFFQALARDPKLKFRVGYPNTQRPGMVGSIPVARRLGTPQGQFDGVIVASVEPKYFRDFYLNLDLGPHASIGLYQNNGTVLLASTSEIRPGQPEDETGLPPRASAEVFDRGTDLGQFRSPWTDDHPQLVAYHRAQGYPLVVAVGIDLAQLRGNWWHVAAPTLGAVAAAAALGIALAVLLSRRLDERQQAQARALTTQKLEALGQMTASVSHDFRNLLTVMTATLRLVRRQGPDEKILGAAEAAIERGSGLVSQLLAFSRQQDLELRAADINVLLSGIENVLRHAAGAGIALTIDKTPGLPLCKTDQTQFDAAVMNLVVNARQAMPHGGTIAISTRLGDGAKPKAPACVELSVADTGCGIAPGDLKRIFEPFFTTKAETGTGLGLSQVYGFMRQIGGDVTVATALGQGTRFTLLFPIAEGEAVRGLAAYDAARRREGGNARAAEHMSFERQR